MHERLDNWARAQFNGSGSSTSPMFRLYRSDEVWQGSFARDPVIPVDQQDAAKIAKGVRLLPEPHMLAITWSYTDGNPGRGCKRVGCTKSALQRYVSDGRNMLINRRV